MSRYSDLVIADGSTNLLGYWPLDAEFGVTDKSTGGHNGTAAGTGFTAASIGTATGPGELTATDFPGVDQRVTTAYGVRRNLVTNPSFEVNTTGWGGSQGGETLSRVTTDSTVGAACLQVTCASVNQGGAGPSGGAARGYTVSPGDVISASMYLKAPVGVSLKVWGEALDAAGTRIGTFDQGATAMDGTWKLVKNENLTMPALTAKVAFRALVSTIPAGGTYLVDGHLIEKASSAGTYFDGSLTSTQPDVAWEGTANASVSSKGVFANGTVRTFEGWANRDNTSALHAIFGATANANAMCYLPNAGSTTIRVLGTSDIAYTSASIAPGSWFHWMIVWDTTSGSATVYINGASLGAGSPGTYPATPGNFEVGTRLTTSNPFDGKQGHVAVYNGDQSALANVHYNAGLWALTRPTGPAPWY